MLLTGQNISPPLTPILGSSPIEAILVVLCQPSVVCNVEWHLKDINRGFNCVYSKLTIVRIVTAGQPRLFGTGAVRRCLSLHHVSEGVQKAHPGMGIGLYLPSLVSWVSQPFYFFSFSFTYHISCLSYLFFLFNSFIPHIHKLCHKYYNVSK
jgi:hypothetical protein